MTESSTKTNIVTRLNCRVCMGNLKEIVSLGDICISDFVKDESELRKIPLIMTECEQCGLVQIKLTPELDDMYRKYWYKSGINNTMVSDLKNIVDSIFERTDFWKSELGETVVDIGCFKSGTRVTLADYTRVPIEDISIGDFVFTSKNNKKMVMDVFNRKYSGNIFTIETVHGNKIVCTDEHPILGIPINSFPKESNLEYIPANLLVKNQYLAVPRLNNISNICDKSDSFMKLCGWYLSEGHILYSHRPRVAGIGLTLNIDETDFVLEIENISKELGYNCTKSIRTNKSTIDLRIYSKNLAEEMLRLFGSNSKEKFIHEEVFEYPTEKKLLLLQTLFNGDGHFRHMSGGGFQYELSSRSDKLLDGIRIILRQLGISSYRFDYRGKAWYIVLSGESINVLKPNSVQYRGRTTIISTDNYMLLKIKSISISHDECQVYNLSIEDDNSYIADNIAVHNCNDGKLLSLYPDSVYKVGFDPALSVAEEANKNCDVFINDYFSKDLYPKDIGKARVITAIAMFYDLPNPHEFISNMKEILAEDGIIVLQFTDLLSTLKINALDNLCFEHIELYKLFDIVRLFDEHGLQVFDVEYNHVNGGSLRVYISRGNYPISPIVYQKIEEERFYLSGDSLPTMQKRVELFGGMIKNYINKVIEMGGTVCGLGASTKGNTLLQVLNLTEKEIKFIGEINSDKFGLKTVTGIPIISEKEVLESNPDLLVIFPWHFTKTFVKVTKNYIENGGTVLYPLPYPILISKKESGNGFESEFI